MHLLFSGRAGFKQAWEGADAAKNAKKPRQVKVPAALPPTTGVVHNWMKSYQAAGSGGGMPDGGMPGGGSDAPAGDAPGGNQDCATTVADDSSGESSMTSQAFRPAAPTTTGVPANSMES